MALEIGEKFTVNSLFVTICSWSFDAAALELPVLRSLCETDCAFWLRVVAVDVGERRQFGHQG